MDPSLIAIEVLNGLVLGVIYALVAAGLTLIFGMLDIPNFAHGAFYALGAYVAYTAMTHAGFPLALVAAPLAVGLLGVVVDALFIRRLARAGHVYQILFTLGVVLIVQEGIVIVWGADPTSVDVPVALSSGISLGAISFPYYRIFLAVVAAALIAVVWLGLERTKLGAIIRAGIEDPEMVDAIGYDVQRLFTIVFGVGVALAAIAGALILPIRGGQPAMGTELNAISFVVVVIGGLGSYAGAVAGGIVVGLVQSLMTLIYPPASEVAIFAAMALVLLVRPQGLFGTR
ncbi:MAG: branched-chain amino acid ABC transporter permease [Candidatus Eremiobacteraeota bacterium]|nr:branched-chain amino acid ABC transporter permease [Candidatus Eremiobacteraeota bacterium]MBV8356196.1 branched-chain amino acid ABC transporter permease [Candidatus Eremiobacteraeota bacterium]